MSKNANLNITRVNFNINNDLLLKVDNFAAENGINRTAAFSVIISIFFRQDYFLNSSSNSSSDSDP